MTRRGPGEGSIYQRGDGRWAGSVHIGYEGGKRVRKHVLGHSRAEVKEKLAKVQRLQAENRPIPDLRIKVGPYLRQWLDEVARPRVRASTLKSYREIVEGHLVPELGHIALAKLTPAEVQAFLNRKQASGLSARRVQYIHAVLRRALVTAERWGLVSRNVARLVDPPRVRRREITPLTPEQARRLIETSIEDRYRALWITALGTGLRQGELLALRWEDVDLKAGRLWVRHTLANVDWHADPAGTQDRPQPTTRRAARGGPCRRCGPTAPVRSWTACGGLTLGRQRSRLRDDAGQTASRRDDHPGLRARSRSRRAPTYPLPRPASLGSDVPAVPGLRPRGRQEPARSQHHRADFEHLRSRARTAAGRRWRAGWTRCWAGSGGRTDVARFIPRPSPRRAVPDIGLVARIRRP